MNPDGSGQTRLTSQIGGGTEPVWSPNGTRIAFWDVRGGNDEIMVINADGTGETNLTNILETTTSHGS